MVKIYAISVFYKSTNDAKLLKSHYDLQSFSFFQRGEILGNGFDVLIGAQNYTQKHNELFKVHELMRLKT